MKYANIVTDAMVLVVNTETGEDVKFFKEDTNFTKAIELIKKGEYAEVFKLDVKNIVTSFFKENDTDDSITITIDGGIGKVILHDYNDMEVELADAITNKIITMHSQGFDCRPLVNFLANLYQNPSQTAIAELYLFLDACNLPITEDGCFIAYKIVRHDYKDIYSGTMDNSIGTLVEMPRGLVDDNRNNICSRGLHFCSKEYLNHYGSSHYDLDRCILVKINPRDVVSIPSDYNNAKGRAAKYLVIGELPSNWRKTIPNKDYTDCAVVDSNGNPETVENDFYYSVREDQWYESGIAVDHKYVQDKLGLSYEELDNYQNYIADSFYFSKG
jgi:hypothetical protein